MQTQSATPSVTPGVTIPTHAVNDDMVILLDDGSALVSSKSRPSHWRPVENGRCTCPGFQVRGTCRHAKAAADAVEQDRQTAELMAGVCPCGAPWTVKVDGKLYCGACAPAPSLPRGFVR